MTERLTNGSVRYYYFALTCLFLTTVLQILGIFTKLENKIFYVSREHPCLSVCISVAPITHHTVKTGAWKFTNSFGVSMAI